jgi:hypothetical protein
MRHTRTTSKTKQQLSSKREHKLTDRQDTRYRLQIDYENGLPIRMIEQKYSKYLAERWIGEYKDNDEQAYYMGKTSPGRPSKVNPVIEGEILRMIKEEMSLDRMATFLKDKYQDKENYMKDGKRWSISPTTISRHLHSIGCKPRAKRRQPAITAEQEKKRVKLAKELKDENLEKYIFVDETWVADHGKTNSRNDRQWVFDPSEIVPRKVVAHPAKIGYFGGIGFNGTTPLIEIFRDDKPTFDEMELKKSQKKLKKLATEQRKADEKEAKRVERIERKKRAEAEKANKVKKTKTQIKKEADRNRKEKKRLKEERDREKKREREEKKISKIEKQMERAGKKNMRRRTNAKIYIEKCLKPLIKHLDSIYPERDYTIVQDGAPYHSAKMVSKFFNDKGINFIGGGAGGKWPGNSPDLNPEENIWAIMKGNAYREPTHNLDELDKRVREVYNYISKKTCQKTILGMKKRFKKVIELNGKYIGK